MPTSLAVKALALRMPWRRRRSTRLTPAEIVARYRSYFLVSVLAFRSLSATPPLVILIGLYGLQPVLPLAIVWSVVVVLNAAAIPLVIRWWSLSPTRSLPWVCLDGVVAVALNLWCSAVIPGSANDPYHDLFFFWCMGTAVLACSVFGVRGGVVVSLASIPLQLGMNAVSQQEPIDKVVPMLVGRTTWLLVGTTAGGLFLWIMRAAVERVRAEGVLLGRKSVRIRALRELHDTALQTLEAIRLTAENDGLDESRRLRVISDAARRQAADIRGTLAEQEDGQDTEVDVIRGLEGTVRVAADRLGQQGVRVVLRTDHVGPLSVSRHRAEAMNQAVQEALQNVRKHAKASLVIVTAELRLDRLELTVADDGQGFEVHESMLGFGVRHSMRERLEEVGGAAEIRSGPGVGTLVTLWMPR
jgi:signal transduction histidine kinase